MEPRINTEELEAIEAYLFRAQNGELQDQAKPAVYSEEERSVVFPAVRNLLNFKAQENKRLNKKEYQYNHELMYLMSDNNPRYMFSLIVTYPAMLSDILLEYRQALHKIKQAETHARLTEQRRARVSLFDLNISEMTPAQYAQFKQIISASI